MHIVMAKPLFAWDCLEDSPSLITIKEFLASVPDAKLLEMLRQCRGRDNYPVHVLWGLLLLRMYSYDRTSLPILRHKMSYIGYQPEPETIKYRWPGAACGWTCPHNAVCNAGKSYSKTVRVDRSIDLWRFPPIPRATKKFERLYDGRTSVERVNARLKILWGVDDGNITGSLARGDSFSSRYLLLSTCQRGESRLHDPPQGIAEPVLPLDRPTGIGPSGLVVL